MSGYKSITPSINVNTTSGQLRTELLNTFSRLDGQLSLAPYRAAAANGPSSSVLTGETTLMTANIDVNTLSKVSSSLLIFACGTTAANSNNKTLNLYFGTSQIFTTGAFAGNGISWTLQAEIVRSGQASQITWAQFFGSATLTSKVQVGSANMNLATNQTITLTGQGTSTGDITSSYWKILLLS